MDIVSQLTKQFMDHMNSMYREGYLDDQFGVLQKLQDVDNPKFVNEVVSLFFEDSEELLNILANCMQNQIVDYQELFIYVCRFKGSSASSIFFSIKLRCGIVKSWMELYPIVRIGALKVNNVCVALSNSCQENNRDGCLECLRKLQHEYNVVKSKFDYLFMLEKQIAAAGGRVPTMF